MVTFGGSHILWLVIKGAATHYTPCFVNYRYSIFSVFDDFATLIRSVVPRSVLAPAPGIAVHVEQSEIIRL
jgi:hypothetical protein